MIGRIATIWTGLSGRQKIGFGALAASVLIGIVSAVIGVSRPQYASLYSDLSPSDAGAIVDKLKTLKVDYRIAHNGTAIEVPQDKVYELRLSLAQEGLPGGGQTGFELFDKSSLPGTEFSNNVNYQRALQGELARTISSMQEVRNARVHLALPKASLFADKEQATASVVLDVKPPNQLSSAQVRGIVHLVSCAVENLKPTNVTIITTRGEFLAGADGEGESGQLSLTQLETQRDFEEQLRRRLQSMMDTSVGADLSVVRVRAALDFGTEQTDTETIEPLNGKQGLVSKENTTEEQYAGAKPAVGGVAGVSGNLNPRAATGAGRQGTYTSKTEQREYQYSRNVKHAKKAAGAVKQLTVAAVVDDSVSNVSNEQVAGLLSAAAGIDQARGDKVVVERMSMASKKLADDEQKTAVAAEGAARRSQMYRAGALCAIPLTIVAAFGAALAIRRRRTAQQPAQAVMPAFEQPLETPMEPMAQADTPEGGKTPAEESEAGLDDEDWFLPNIDLESAQASQLEEYLRRVADAQAEAVAKQIQTLLAGAK